MSELAAKVQSPLISKFIEDAAAFRQVNVEAMPISSNSNRS